MKEIRYNRNFNASHMVIEQTEGQQAWERRMLEENRTDELLAPDYVSENGKCYLWYDITGRQALDVIVDSAELNYELLEALCMALTGAVKKAEELLLSPDGMLLEPECIFVENRTGKISFCYYPGNEAPLKESFHGLLEYLLTKLNHGDRRVVESANQLYECTGMDGYCMTHIYRALRQGCRTEETEICQDESRDAEPAALREREDIRNCEEEMPKNLQGEKAVGIKRAGMTLAEIVKKLIKAKLPATGELRKGRKSLIPKKRREEPFVFEPETESEMQRQQHPTVLLSEITNHPLGILKYEGNGCCGELKIDHTPYVIGSDAACDGILNSDTVSRRHARITKKGEVYFIEDLNSTNGTFVGGELINCRIRMSLTSNETVAFADEKFRFI